MRFFSDNAAAAHPKVIEAIATASRDIHARKKAEARKKAAMEAIKAANYQEGKAILESTLKNAEMRERITAEGFETGDTSAARLRDVIKRDIAKWSRVVKEANIKVAQ